MSTTTIPTKLAHDIAARLCQEADNGARELRTRLMACMQDATSPGLALVRPHAEPEAAAERFVFEVNGAEHAVEVGPVEPAANAPDVEPQCAETSEWRANLEADQEAEPDEFKPVAGPLGLAIFVDGEHTEARDGYAVPRKGDVILVGRSRCLVMLVEWHSMEVIHVHTLLMPSVDGGPF